MNLRQVERRLVAPFYLEMMGSNVTWLNKRTYRRLDDVLYSLARCDGDLRAAPLRTAAVLIAGDGAVETLRSNRLRAEEHEADAVMFLDAALEHLGEVPAEPPVDGMREHFQQLVDFGGRLRHDLAR